MSTAVEGRAGTVIVVRKSDRGPMISGGTVSYTVELDGRCIRWLGDGRRFIGSAFGARRWWACWCEDGDAAARWNSTGHRSRTVAIDALAAQVRGTR